MDDVSYYMTEEEFYLLLAGKGIERWYGLTSDARGAQARQMDQREIYRALTSLYQKELVSWKEDKVHLEPFAEEMMGILLHSSCCMRYANPDSGEQMIYYFYGNRAIMLEVSQTQRNTFRVSVCLQADVLERMLDDEIFPEEDCFFDEEEETLSLSVNPDAIIRGSLLFLHPRTGQEMEKITVTEEGIDVFLNIDQAGFVKKVPYRQKTWQQELNHVCSVHD